MGSFFQVDLDALRQFVTTLQQSGDHMQTALDSMKSGGSGQIGSSDLNEAADEFQDKWRYGLGRLKSAIGDTHQSVSQAHDAYQQFEQQVAQSLGQLGEALGG